MAHADRSGTHDSTQQILKSVKQTDDNRALFKDVQGDILVGGLPKKTEIFSFFTIRPDHVKTFCVNLGNATGDGLLTFSSVQNVLDERRKFRGRRRIVPSVGANIAFSFRGLTKMSQVLETDLKLGSLPFGDNPFTIGMKQDAAELADPPEAFAEGTPFGDENIDGVVLVAGSNDWIVKSALSGVLGILGFTNDDSSTLTEVVREIGHTRPGENSGKEHFGFEDGISQPNIRGIDDADADPVIPDNVIDRKFVLTGPDTHQEQRWMTNGSFLCFRKLEQHVDKWDEAVLTLADKAQADPILAGTKLIGRWPSGAPLMLTPHQDDQNLKTSNSFANYDESAAGNNADNHMCPLGAHIRKTNPRHKFFDQGGAHRILRRGIPYGPDFNRADRDDPVNQQERGLLFACYQSNLQQGFHFIQQTWANNPSFPGQRAGVDLVMGQTGTDELHQMDVVFGQGKPPVDPNQFSGINKFVVSKGGEYFFSPSFTAMREALSKVKA